MVRGWYREQYKHSLAARGIKTSFSSLIGRKKIEPDWSKILDKGPIKQEVTRVNRPLSKKAQQLRLLDDLASELNMLLKERENLEKMHAEGSISNDRYLAQKFDLENLIATKEKSADSLNKILAVKGAVPLYEPVRLMSGDLSSEEQKKKIVEIFGHAPGRKSPVIVDVLSKAGINPLLEDMEAKRAQAAFTAAQHYKMHKNDPEFMKKMSQTSYNAMLNKRAYELGIIPLYAELSIPKTMREWNRQKVIEAKIPYIENKEQFKALLAEEGVEHLMSAKWINPRWKQ
jgi:hypothetical protein